MTPPDNAHNQVTDLLGYLRVTRTSWRLIALVTGACVLAILAWTLTRTPQYEATSIVTLRPVLNTDRSMQMGMSKAFVQSQVALLSASPTQEAVEDLIGPPATAIVQAEPDETGNISITSIADDPDRAALVANTYVDVFKELRLEEDLALNRETAAVLRERLATLDSEPPELPGEDPASRRARYVAELQYLEDQEQFILAGRIDVLEPAAAPSRPRNADIPRALGLGLLVGLMAGIGAALLRHRLNDRVDSTEALELATGGLPLLGAIPRDKEWEMEKVARVSSWADSSGPVSEAYRTLRTSLQFAATDGDLRMVQVTSSRSFEGKSTTVANLGVTMARAGQRVLLIDLDLRRPRMHKFFNLDNTVGFKSIITDDTPPDRAIAFASALPNLGVLTSGPRPANPSEFLASAAVQATLTRLAADWDIVIVDSPPVLGVSDPLVIARLVDATLLIVRSGSTRTNEVRSTTNLLRKVQAPLLGAVVNDVVARGAAGYGYGYGYEYDYRYNAEYTNETALVEEGPEAASGQPS